MNNKKFAAPWHSRADCWVLLFRRVDGRHLLLLYPPVVAVAAAVAAPYFT